MIGGEQFLQDGDVCNLGAINLANFVSNGLLDKEKLIFTVKTATRMLDNVIDTFNIPVKRVQEMSQKTRRCGEGLMGFAEYLIQRGIGYDTEEALEEIDVVMSLINEYSIRTTRELALEKGVFPAWNDSVYAKTNDRRRNAFLTSMAPTGTISMLMTPTITGGIEPVFAWAYKKSNILGGMSLSYDCNYLLEKALKDERVWSTEVIEQIVSQGSVQHINKISDNIKKIFKSSHDISPFAHVSVQARFQKHVENAISKTINFPHNATRENVMEAYTTAWKMGCKGLTVYRDGSRQIQILELTKTMEKKAGTSEEIKAKEALDKAVKENRNVLIQNAMNMKSSFDQDLLPERALTPVMKHGDNMIIEQEGLFVSPLPKSPGKRFKPIKPDNTTNCPECETDLNRQEGCVTCPQCAWSKCG